MDEDTPQFAPEKPRFLLPDGCKDLIDALRLQQRQAEERRGPAASVALQHSDPPEKLPASVTLLDPVTVGNLASVLHISPYRLIHALMEANIFASLVTELDFKSASVLCSRARVVAQRQSQ